MFLAFVTMLPGCSLYAVMKCQQSDGEWIDGKGCEHDPKIIAECEQNGGRWLGWKGCRLP